jgi:hypothetical protein
VGREAATGGILSGHEARLRLAKIERDEAGLLSVHLYIHDTEEGEVAALSVKKWSPSDRVPPSLRFQVTLSAIPEIRGGAVVCNFALTPAGLSELPDYFFG